MSQSPLGPGKIVVLTLSVLVLAIPAVFPQTSTTPTTSNPQAVTLAAQALAALVFCSSGQRRPATEQSSTVSFYAVSDLTKPKGAQVTLRGARLADPKDWPASFYSIHPGGPCTSTLVGPRALITAAHCAPNRAPVAIKLGDSVYRGTCVQSDAYLSGGDESADWAMCLMSTDVPETLYETINTDAARLRVGTQILLTGFGCTQSSGTPSDRNYRIGEANIDSLPTRASNYLTTTGRVALCFGDSGGPAFLILDSTKRVQVSVNSEAQILPDGSLGQTSSLSSLSTDEAVAFAKGWSSANHANVCGITPNMSNCR